MENLLNRSVRLDILATDSTGRKINVEIQRSDKGAGRKRARYNSSMMDANLLRKGEKFDELPETYVVFITEHDVIGKGRPLYHIGRYIFDTNESFDDGFAYSVCERRIPGRDAYWKADARFFLHGPGRYAL